MANGIIDGSNYSLRDEIKAYWSERALTFDLSAGHEIFSEKERAAWHDLIVRHLGRGEGRAALDLACGTGVVSNLLDEIGFAVTGIDWAEPMIKRARHKAASRQRNITFMLGDAENTMEPDNHYDVITNRHLVWTLVDPQAAFAEWLRVLKPGGRLLIVDGDFVNISFKEQIVAKVSALFQRLGFASGETAGMSPQLVETHRSILSRVYFSDGAKAGAVAELLRKVGFESVKVDSNLRRIHRAQAKHLGFWKGMARIMQHRYAIVAIKGDVNTR